MRRAMHNAHATRQSESVGWATFAGCLLLVRLLARNSFQGHRPPKDCVSAAAAARKLRASLVPRRWVSEPENLFARLLIAAVCARVCEPGARSQVMRRARQNDKTADNKTVNGVCAWPTPPPPLLPPTLLNAHSLCARTNTRPVSRARATRVRAILKNRARGALHVRVACMHASIRPATDVRRKRATRARARDNDLRATRKPLEACARALQSELWTVRAAGRLRSAIANARYY